MKHFRQVEQQKREFQRVQKLINRNDKSAQSNVTFHKAGLKTAGPITPNTNLINDNEDEKRVSRLSNQVSQQEIIYKGHVEDGEDEDHFRLGVNLAMRSPDKKKIRPVPLIKMIQ